MQKHFSRRALLATGAVFSVMSQRVMAATATVVTGAGSTFVEPILTKWTQDYMADYHLSGGTRISYQANGSGAGIEMIKAGKVDFGATDMPLTPQELKPFGLAQFPLVIGGVVPVVNIPGVAGNQLKFTGGLLADIYLGKIVKWSDPALARINPGVALPDAKITVVHRSDGSGTTFNFVNFLSKHSPEWKTKVGEGTTVNWPIGLAGNGNGGVTQLMQQTPYSLGYVEYALATRNHLTTALVQNLAGSFVTANAESFQAAADGANWQARDDFYLILTDTPARDAYPITATTFVLVKKKLNNYSKTRALLQLFEWALSHGQPQAQALGYVPLPDKLTYVVMGYWTTDIEH